MSIISDYSLSDEGADVIIKNLIAYEYKMRAAIYILADTGAKLMESWAKENAPWTDRTSNARQGIKGQAYWNSDTIIVTLSHSVNYGIWLELANHRNYAILEKSINAEKDTLIQNYKKLLGA